MLTIQEKLAVIEHLIEDFRWARSDPAVPEHSTYHTLKAIAADHRARLYGTPSAVEVLLERRVRAAGLTGAPRHGALIGLAQDVLAHWPSVKQGLELLGRVRP